MHVCTIEYTNFEKSTMFADYMEGLFEITNNVF